MILDFAVLLATDKLPRNSHGLERPASTTILHCHDIGFPTRRFAILPRQCLAHLCVAFSQVRPVRISTAAAGTIPAAAISSGILNREAVTYVVTASIAESFGPYWRPALPSHLGYNESRARKGPVQHVPPILPTAAIKKRKTPMPLISDDRSMSEMAIQPRGGLTMCGTKSLQNQGL